MCDISMDTTTKMYEGHVVYRPKRSNKGHGNVKLPKIIQPRRSVSVTLDNLDRPCALKMTVFLLRDQTKIKLSTI